MNDIHKFGRVGLKAIAQVNPVSAAFEVTLSALEEERVQTYIEEISRRGVNLDEDLLAKSKEILHAHIITLRAIVNVHRHQKIKRFAALFSHFVTVGEAARIDRYEEALKILDDLSEIEYQVLLILHQLESENPPIPGANSLIRIKLYWKEFLDRCHRELAIDSDEMRGRLGRMTRTGLVQGLDVSYYDDSGGKFYITQFYGRFMESIDTPIGKEWIPISEQYFKE